MYIKTKVEYSPKSNYISSIRELRLTPEHKKAIGMMRESCLKQLRDNREVSGFVQIRHPEDSEEQQKLSDACCELVALGIFKFQDDAWHCHTYEIVDGLDWTEI